MGKIVASKEELKSHSHDGCICFTVVNMYIVAIICITFIITLHLRYSPVTTSHTRNLSRVVPRVIQREDKICHA